jgi:hypothetical protein
LATRSIVAHIEKLEQRSALAAAPVTASAEEILARLQGRLAVGSERRDLKLEARYPPTHKIDLGGPEYVERMLQLAQAARTKATPQESHQPPAEPVISADRPFSDLQPWSTDRLRLTDHNRAPRAVKDWERQDRLEPYRHQGTQPLEPDRT